MKTKKKYSGVVIPAVTPLTEEKKIDHGAVERMFDNFHRHGVSPFILGTTGEAASLSQPLKTDFIQLAGRLKKENDVLYVGISSNCVAETISLAKQSFDNGVDVVVTTLPSYYPLKAAVMLRYFEELAEAISGPLMIYNIPSTTHMSIPLEVIEKLSHHPNIVGVKDSQRSKERVKKSLQRWAQREDFSYFLGWAAKSAEALLRGADGLVPSTGNFLPFIYAEMFQAAESDNKERTFRLQRLSDLGGEIYQKGRTLGESLWALKVVMKERGLCEPNVLPPVYPQSAEEEKTIQAAFQKFVQDEDINFNV